MLRELVLLRKANLDDAEFLWDLANDPEVRAFSFSTSFIPWQDHLKWLKTKLADSKCFLFIATTKTNIPIGQVRFEISNDEAVVSLSVRKEFRSRGYGKRLIRLSAKTLLETTKIDKIHAFIKTNNESSAAAFLNGNFKLFGIATFKGHEAFHLILER